MKKSDETIKKRILDTTPTPEKVSQAMNAEAATSAKQTTLTSGGNNFFGVFRRLMCSPSTNLCDDKSEIVFIPKTQQPK